jgi:hypothetical protein
MEREDEIWPVLPSQNSVGPVWAFETSQCEEGRRELARRERSARTSCCGEGNGRELRTGFPMLELVGDDAKRERLDFRLRFLLGRAICEHPGKV